MVINAFNSGADSYADRFRGFRIRRRGRTRFRARFNLGRAIRRTLTLEQNGKSYRLNDKIATLQVRPRGWHLDEKHVLIDGQRVHGGIFDFALFMFHNAKEQIARSAGPFFYLPRWSRTFEARLVERRLRDDPERTGPAAGHHQGDGADPRPSSPRSRWKKSSTNCASTAPASTQAAGTTSSRASRIPSSTRTSATADRAQVKMTAPFMRCLCLAAVEDLPQRGAPAIGGMSALSPDQERSEKNAIAMAGIIADKKRDATDGYDGGWVAHPGLVEASMKSSSRCSATSRTSGKSKSQKSALTAADLLNFQPETPITEAGLRMNINVGIHYLGAWLAGNGCVPIHNLMEDAATAEISRSQVWQWIRSPKGVLDGRPQGHREMVKAMVPEELAKDQGGWLRQASSTARPRSLRR